MKEYLLDTPLPAEFFSFLGYFGTVEAMPSVGPGFYKFEKADWFSVKGFVGDCVMEVRFRKEVMDMTVDFLYFLVASYQEGIADLSVLKRREGVIQKRVQMVLYGT